MNKHKGSVQNMCEFTQSHGFPWWALLFLLGQVKHDPALPQAEASDLVRQVIGSDESSNSLPGLPPDDESVGFVPESLAIRLLLSGSLSQTVVA